MRMDGVRKTASWACRTGVSLFKYYDETEDQSDEQTEGGERPDPKSE